MDNKNGECPLCMEQLEMDDINFFPCKCGYQICRFCWHRIRTNDNGLCPHCRRHYPENPANFKPLTAEELQQFRNKKKQKDLKKKQKNSEGRKQLANIRVVQKNLVFVVGLPQRLVDASESEKSSYFKQFGKIQKLIINTNTTYAGSQGPSSCAYVTYHKPHEAYSAVQALNNTKVEGRNIKASLGTTKYCSNFLKKTPCQKQDCMYLHEFAESAASFTKEQIQLGKHLEYEQKLYEQIANSQNHNRKESSCSELTDSDDSLQKGKIISSNVLKDQSKECFQSCHTGKDSTVNFAENNQIIQSQDHVKLSPKQICDQALQSLFLHCEVPSSQSDHSNKMEQNLPVLSSKNMPCDNSNTNSFFSNVNFSPIKNETSSQEHYNGNGSSAINSHLLEFQPRKHNFVEANQEVSPTESSSAHLNSVFSNIRLSNSQIPEKKSLLTLFNNSEDTLSENHLPSSPFPSNFSHLIPTRNSSLFFNSYSSSSQKSSESSNHVPKNIMSFPSVATNGDIHRDNAFQESHDDDLGFDPCQESLKGLKDLISKEAADAERIIFSSNIKSVQPVIAKAFTNHSSELNDARNNFHTHPRFPNPPPGFQLGGFTSSTHPFVNANLASNRPPQVLNFQNHFQPVRSQFPINRLPLQNGLHNGMATENRLSMFHEGFELPSRKLLSVIPQSAGSPFSQPPFSNVGQSPPLSWNGVGQVNNTPIKPLENLFYNPNFVENRSVSPHTIRALQQNFNELSMRQMQQNGVKHDSAPHYTDQLYATLLRNLPNVYPNGT